MDGRVLIVESSRPIAGAVARVLDRRGYRATVASSCKDACAHPGPFDCGIFGVKLPDGDGVSLAGWLIAEERVRSVLFFDDTTESDVRLRASNLGSFVHREEGVKALCDAVDEIVSAALARAKAVGAEDDVELRAQLKSGRRRKRGL